MCDVCVCDVCVCVRLYVWCVSVRLDVCVCDVCVSVQLYVCDGSAEAAEFDLQFACVYASCILVHAWRC